jgi:hypothetical protein
MLVKQNSFTHLRVLLVFTHCGILAHSRLGQLRLSTTLVRLGRNAAVSEYQ